MCRVCDEGRFRRACREPILWAVLTVSLVVLIRPFSGGALFFRDISLHNIPTKMLLASEVHQGHLPVWNLWHHGGQPFVGSPTSTVLYPTNLLYLVVSAPVAFVIDIALHQLLSVLFAYTLARWLRVSTVAAGIAGIAYSLCGYSVSLANLYQKALAMPWLPLFVLALLRARREVGPRWVLVASAALAIQILAGSPETVVVTVVTATLWMAFTRDPAASGDSRRLALALVLAVGLAAVQIAPSLEMTSVSSRSDARPYASFVRWSMHPARLGELVVPGFFGRTDTLSEAGYWGREREDTGFPYILSIYLGIPLLLLAGVGVLHGELSLRLRWLLAILALAALTLSMGRYLPGFEIVHRIPFVNIFRYPIKSLLLALLPIALLAGAGADALRVGAWRSIRLAALVIAGVICGLAAVWQTEAGVALSRFFFSAQVSPRFRPELDVRLLHATVVAVAAAACMSALHRGRRQALLALVATDLAVAGWAVNAHAPRSLFDEPPLVPAVRSIVGREGRFYRAPDPPPLVLRAPSDDVMWLVRYNIETLEDYVSAGWGIRNIFHSDYDGLRWRGLAPLARELKLTPLPRALPLLSVANVQAILAPTDLNSPSLQLLDVVHEPGRPRLFFYANRDARRLRFVTTLLTADTQEDALNALTSPGFDPERMAVIETDTAPPIRSDATATLRIEEDQPTRLCVRVLASGPGVLTIAEPRYPGWRALVDGREVQSLPTNVAFAGVAVPAGDHRIEWLYSPRWLVGGLVISLLSTLIAILSCWRTPANSTAIRNAPKDDASGVRLSEGTG